MKKKMIKYLSKLKNLYLDNKCKIEDRNLEIIFYEKFENKDYSKPEFINKKYGIWLIGYDGIIKDFSSDDKIFFRLFDLIDSMPMRKDEISNDQCQ
tara:strand:- start:277 stop:564 length:288 start_codon:yes stop_codon:yes gene_type:complete